MQFNFFGWIREGVKEAVLMGVSDAVEKIGVPEDTQEEGRPLLDFLRTPDGNSEDGGKGSRGGKRRLGRSLKKLSDDSGDK